MSYEEKIIVLHKQIKELQKQLSNMQKLQTEEYQNNLSAFQIFGIYQSNNFSADEYLIAYALTEERAEIEIDEMKSDPGSCYVDDKLVIHNYSVKPLNETIDINVSTSLYKNGFAFRKIY